MRVERLAVERFRNLRQVELFPDPEVNLIYGNNAQGKTNLVEAIYLLTGQKSFRQVKDSDLVLFGEQQAVLSADFFAGGRSQQATLTIGTKKTATLNEVAIPPTELTGRFYAVVFSPTELSLIKDGPSMRRAFLDSAISQVMPRYLKTLAAMNRALYQRNSLLGEMRNHMGLEDTLDAWDHSLCRLSYAVIHARRRYVARLEPCARENYGAIASDKEQLSLSYQSSVAADWDGMTNAEGERAVLTALTASRQEDIRCGFTTVGPQRDDLELAIDGVSARSFGSQGQQRSSALALKLAECSLIEEICGEAPVVLLDDVLSELDKGRRDFFLRGVSHGQLFITSCEPLSMRYLGYGKRIRVVDGTATTPRSRKRKGACTDVSPSGAGNGHSDG
ncbi:MAG: DNA replication/repair protein RecF [Angelakisella sp.]